MINPNYPSTPEEVSKTELFDGQIDPDIITMIELTEPHNGGLLPHLADALDLFGNGNQNI
jgi:hypothetical protein